MNYKKALSFFSFCDILYPMDVIQENILLASYTTFGIGGPARYFLQAKNVQDVEEGLRWARKKNVEVYIFGGGSNILVADKGYGGLIIQLDKSVSVVENNILSVFAGCCLMAVVETAQQKGFSGIERLAGIPGTIGGAVSGNAGAFGVEIGNIVHRVTALNRGTLEKRDFSSSECEFEYRQSYFKMRPEWVIVSVEIVFSEKDDPSHLLVVMEDTLSRRNAKQAQNVKSAGSYFINPTIEDRGFRAEFELEVGVKSRDNRVPAGWIIDKAGLRGKRVGDAMVSEQHPNYILNVGHATAEDVAILESLIKHHVRDKYNVELQREVKYVGF